MKQDDWTQKLRSRLADRETAVPDDLWNKIEGRLETKEAAHEVQPPETGVQSQRRHASTVRIVAWATAAAAAVTLLVTLGYRTNEDTIRQLAADNVRNAAGGIPQRDAGNSLASAGTGSSRVPQLSVTAVTEYAGDKFMTTAMPENRLAYMQQRTAAANSTADDSVATMMAAETEADVAPKEANREQRQAQTMHRHAVPAQPAYYAYAADATVRGVPSTRWSIGAHTSGTLADSRSHEFPAMRTSSASLMPIQPENDWTKGNTDNPYGGYAAAGDVVLCAKYNEVKHHSQPVSVGVSVGYALNKRLSLTSGLVYTNTSSDFIRSVGNDEVVTNRKLHYIGIPFGLKCSVWGSSRAQVYATAGAQADFNVAARQTEGSVKTDADRDRVQMSANVAAGIQVNVMPKVGLYAEPGLKHYFDNHSSVETVFKEKPWAFSLQVGLRVDM